MDGNFFPGPIWTADNANGLPINAAAAYFYLTETLTPASIYADADLNTPISQPLLADAAGRFATVYLDPAVTYRVIYKDAVGGTIIRTIDPVGAPVQSLASNVTYTPAGAGAVARTVESKLQDTISPLDYGAPRDGVTDARAGWQAAAVRANALGAASGNVVTVDGGGLAYNFISGPIDLSSLPYVKLRNAMFLFGSVAVYAAAIGNVYAAVVGVGTLSADITTLSERSRIGSEEIRVNGAGLADGDLILIGQTSPILNVVGSHLSTDHTINFTSTTGINPSGFLGFSTGEIVAMTGKTATTVTVRSSPEGRGRWNTSAAAIPNGTKAFEMNSGRWGISNRPSFRHNVEANYVQKVRQAGASYAVLLRESLDSIFTPNLAAWVRKVTPLVSPELENITFVGSNSQGRGGGLEYGYYFRLADRVKIRNCVVTKCSDAHGFLDTCFNYSVYDQEMIGKADSSDYDGHYGLVINNGSHWGDIKNLRARKCYKVLHLGASGATTSQTLLGFPRWLTADDLSLDNSGEPWGNAHEAIELNTKCAHIRIINVRGQDCLYGITHEGGDDLNFEGGMLDHWAAGAIVCDGVFGMRGFTVNGYSVGTNSLLAAGTTLKTDVNNSITTIVLEDADWLNDLDNDYTGIVVTIDSEDILLGSTTADGETFTSCTRAYNSTAAASHSAGAIVRSKGLSFAQPFTLDFSDTMFFINDPDVYPTYLTGSLTDVAATIAVAELSVFPDGASATAPGFAEIEGEAQVNNVYASEVISYAAKSATSGAGNLTGCVRGVRGTKPVAHSANMLIAPHTYALENCDLHLPGQQSIDRQALYIYGPHPSRNCHAHVDLKWTGAGRMSTYIGVIEPHRWSLTGSIWDTSYGLRVYGRECSVEGLKGIQSVPEVTAGQMIRLEGAKSNARGNFGQGQYLLVAVVSGADGCIVHNNSGRTIAAGTNGIDDAASGTSKVNNTVI